ncbi:ESX secretion-associated protein EspG [Nocardia sp. NPDC058666]|uniref:ESX secretion-associated protein EspG n=1 Tax=unclassified Nocardia TaxID=2637762 RepID=UPI00364B5E26
MMVRWRFTEAEFYVLWMDKAGMEPPEPFMFTSLTRTPEDLRIELREARASLNEKMDGDFHAAFDAMANPDMYLSAYGWNDQDPWGVDSQIRVRATRKGPRGYLITQLPGATYWRRGGYTVSECDPIELSNVVIDAMPSAERGSRGDMALTAPDQDLDYDHGRSVVSGPLDTAVNKTEKFLQEAALAAGEIYVVQGRSVFGPRGATRHLVRFRDLADDGRYVITENPAYVRAVDRTRFVSVLNSHVALVIAAIKDERGSART